MRGLLDLRNFDEIVDLTDVDVVDDRFFIIPQADELRRDDAHERETRQSFVTLAVPFEHHPVDRSAAGAFGDQVETGDLDHGTGLYHLVRDVVVVDRDVLRRSDPFAECLDELAAIVIRESAADACKLVKSPVVAQDGDEQIVKHSFSIVRAFGKTDNGAIDIVPRFYFEKSGGIVADDDTLGAFAD